MKIFTWHKFLFIIERSFNNRSFPIVASNQQIWIKRISDMVYIIDMNIRNLQAIINCVKRRSHVEKRTGRLSVKHSSSAAASSLPPFKMRAAES